MPPLVNCGQRLPGKFGVSESFVPTDSSYGQIGSPVRIGAEAPICRARPTGEIVEFGHRLFPRKGTAFFQEWLLPIFRLSVAARVDKFLELTIGDLVAVDPETWKREDGLNLACRRGRHPHHS